MDWIKECLHACMHASVCQVSRNKLSSWNRFEFTHCSLRHKRALSSARLLDGDGMLMMGLMVVAVVVCSPENPCRKGVIVVLNVLSSSRMLLSGTNVVVVVVELRKSASSFKSLDAKKAVIDIASSFTSLKLEPNELTPCYNWSHLQHIKKQKKKKKRGMPIKSRPLILERNKGHVLFLPDP